MRPPRPRGTACSRPRPRPRAGRARPAARAPDRRRHPERRDATRNDRTTRTTTPSARGLPPCGDPWRAHAGAATRRARARTAPRHAPPTPTRAARTRDRQCERRAPRGAQRPRQPGRVHPADRRMRRIHSAASASSTRPDDEADPSDTGVDQRGDRTRVDQRREREVPERRRAHDDRRQPGLRRQRSGLGHRVEAMPQRRRQARRWRRRRAHPWCWPPPARRPRPGRRERRGRPAIRPGPGRAAARAACACAPVGGRSPPHRRRWRAVSTAAATVPPPRSSAATCSSAPGRPAAKRALAAGTSEDQRDRPGGQHPEDAEHRRGPGPARRRAARPRLARCAQYSTASSGVHGTSASCSATTNRARSAFRHPPPRPRTERPCSVRDRSAATRGDQPRAREWPHDHEHEGQHGRSHFGSQLGDAPRRARARRRDDAAHA